MPPSETVAVLGAGSTMGFPIARNIARAGIETRAWNRTPDKAQPLAEDGATVVGSPAEAVAGASVVLTMVADTDAVIETIEPALFELDEHATWLQMSTIGEAGTARCAELAREHGLMLIDAPVLGTKQPAHDAKLVVLASGPDDARERAKIAVAGGGDSSQAGGDD
jgi:3-hydroxyisobutyrate dehydrogenase